MYRTYPPLAVCEPRRYAYFKKLDYFSTECIYSPNAYRGFAREFLKELEAVRPSAILGMHAWPHLATACTSRSPASPMPLHLPDIIHSAEHFHVKAKTRMPVQRTTDPPLQRVCALSQATLSHLLRASSRHLRALWLHLQQSIVQGMRHVAVLGPWGGEVGTWTAVHGDAG